VTRAPLRALLVALGTASCGARTGLDVIQAATERDSGVGAGLDGAPFLDAAPASASCVLYGGYRGAEDTDTSDTWLWDGAAWTASPTQLSPTVCMGQCGYDGVAVNVSGRILFIGAESSTGAAAMETFAWTGSTWTPVATSNSPPARFYPAVVALEQQVVLFGGVPPSGPFSFMNDTWVLDGTTWRQVAASPAPSGRGRAAAASVGGQMLLFGGADTNGALGDTWVWAGNAWRPGPGTMAPSARSGAIAAGIGGVALLFGGCVGGGYTGCPDVGTSSAETWQWAPEGGWALMQPATSPPARNSASMTTFGSRVMLFGGFTGPGAATVLGDTWFWDGGWSEAAPSGPPPRASAALACE
jgi:hypothetical protein